MLSTVKNKIIKIDPEDVLEQARKHDLDVQTVEDFRNQGPHYERIETIMDDYRASFKNSSILSGLTTGIGGFTTSVTFAGLDTISLSIQLYRLSQRFAILNGFDGEDPLQQDKMLNIYFESLSLNAITQATLKHQILRAHSAADGGGSSNNLILRAIINIGKLMGENMSSKKAGRFIPIFGGVVGATVNYSFANATSKRMKKAYRRAYFDTWQTDGWFS